MKDLKNLKGAKQLSKNEQQMIKGGKTHCDDYTDPTRADHLCGPGFGCIYTQFTYVRGVLVYKAGHCGIAM